MFSAVNLVDSLNVYFFNSANLVVIIVQKKLPLLVNLLLR